MSRTKAILASVLRHPFSSAFVAFVVAIGLWLYLTHVDFHDWRFMPTYGYESSDGSFWDAEIPERGRTLTMVESQLEEYKSWTRNNSIQLMRTTKPDWSNPWLWLDNLTHRRWKIRYKGPPTYRTSSGVLTEWMIRMYESDPQRLVFEIRDAPNVQFSQLIKNVDRYNGKLVRLEAVLLDGFEQQNLLDPLNPDCQRSIWAEWTPWCSKNNPQGYESLHAVLKNVPQSLGTTYVDVVVVGKFEAIPDKVFEGKGDGFGHMGYCQFQLTVLSWEQAKLIEYWNQKQQRKPIALNRNRTVAH